MPNTREKLIELLDVSCTIANNKCGATACDDCDGGGKNGCTLYYIADHLIANGVTVQDDMTELIGRGLDNIYWKMYGANKEFNERMAGYTPSAFCAGFEYAIHLAKGLLTQLPQPPKGE